MVRWLRADYAALPSYMIEQGEKSEELKKIQERNYAQSQPVFNASELSKELNSEVKRESV